MRKRFNCNKCEFKTTSNTTLQSHVDSKHKNTDSKTSKRKHCEICIRKFNKENTYNEHMRKHHKEGQSNQNKTK